VDLAIEAFLVGYVHRDVHRIRAIERRIGKRHAQRIADLESNLVLQADRPCERERHFAEFAGQVDAGDPAAEAGGHHARWSADPAADIEQMVGRSGFHQPDHLVGRLDAAGMELVVRRERVDRRPFGIGTVGRKGSLQPGEQAAAAVVGDDVRRRSRHPILIRIDHARA
jgi:hypothetical protein